MVLIYGLVFPDITHNQKIIGHLAAMTYFLSESCLIANSSELLVKWMYGINRKFVDRKKVKVIGDTERSNVEIVKL